MPSAAPRQPRWADTVVLGLAAVLGTGMFIVFAPAAGYAGQWLPVATVLAVAAALLSGLSAARLAGAYSEFGDDRHGVGLVRPWAGRLASVAFLAGRTAAAAAAGRVFADYVLPSHPRWVAVVVVLAAGAANLAGVRPTLRGARVLVPALVGVLVVVVVIGSTRRVPPDWSMSALAGGLPPGPADPRLAAVIVPDPTAQPPVTALGVLTAAGLMYFAFAGFPRTAGRAGPGSRRMLPATALLALLGYLTLGQALVHALGLDQLAGDIAPLATAVGGADAPALGVLVRVGAAAATVTALVALFAGGTATVGALAGRRELPGWLSPPGQVGVRRRAGLPVIVVSAVLAAVADPVLTLTATACCALLYDALLHVAALRRPGEDGRRVWATVSAGTGLVLCLVLLVLLPTATLLVTLAVVLAGWAVTTVLPLRPVSLPPPGTAGLGTPRVGDGG
ncbi:MAG TPA: hypothetical protein VGH99_22320 [Pseudonocardia sp.]